MGLNSVEVVSADEQVTKGQLTMSTSDNNIPAGTGMKFGKHLASVGEYTYSAMQACEGIPISKHAKLVGEAKSNVSSFWCIGSD